MMCTVVNYFFLVLFIYFIGYFVYFLNLFFSMIQFSDKEKCLPYECGFSPIFKFMLPVSVPFYLICLMFLIFDIEVVMIIPYVFFFYYLDSSYIMSMFVMFLLVMLFTLLYEWNSKFLDWMF